MAKVNSSPALADRLNLKGDIFRAGLRQKSVASHLHITEVQLSRFLSGQADLPEVLVKKLRKLCAEQKIGGTE